MDILLSILSFIWGLIKIILLIGAAGLLVFVLRTPDTGNKPTPAPKPLPPTNAEILAEMARNEKARQDAKNQAAAERKQCYQKYLQHFDRYFPSFLNQARTRIATTVQKVRQEGGYDYARLAYIHSLGKWANIREGLGLSPDPQHSVKLDPEDIEPWLIHIGKRLAKPLAEVNVVIVFHKRVYSGDNEHADYTEYYLSACWGNTISKLEEWGGTVIPP